MSNRLEVSNHVGGNLVMSSRGLGIPFIVARFRSECFLDRDTRRSSRLLSGRVFLTSRIAGLRLQRRRQVVNVWADE